MATRIPPGPGGLAPRARTSVVGAAPRLDLTLPTPLTVSGGDWGGLLATTVDNSPNVALEKAEHDKKEAPKLAEVKGKKPESQLHAQVATMFPQQIFTSSNWAFVRELRLDDILMATTTFPTLQSFLPRVVDVDVDGAPTRLQLTPRSREMLTSPDPEQSAWMLARLDEWVTAQPYPDEARTALLSRLCRCTGGAEGTEGVHHAPFAPSFAATDTQDAEPPLQVPAALEAALASSVAPARELARDVLYRSLNQHGNRTAANAERDVRAYCTAQGHTGNPIPWTQDQQGNPTLSIPDQYVQWLVQSDPVGRRQNMRLLRSELEDLEHEDLAEELAGFLADRVAQNADVLRDVLAAAFEVMCDLHPNFLDRGGELIVSLPVELRDRGVDRMAIAGGLLRAVAAVEMHETVVRSILHDLKDYFTDANPDAFVAFLARFRDDLPAAVNSKALSPGFRHAFQRKLFEKIASLPQEAEQRERRLMLNAFENFHALQRTLHEKRLDFVRRVASAGE
jgi:hypothetical protein